MPLTISDELLEDAGLSAAEAQVEIACRMYNSSKLTLPQATRWAGLTRIAFEAALRERQLPLVQVDERYWQQELEGLQQFP